MRDRLLAGAGQPGVAAVAAVSASASALDLGGSGFERGTTRAILVLVWLSGAAHGFLVGRLPGDGIFLPVAYGAALGAALLLTDRRPRPLPWTSAAALGACVLTSSVIGLFQFTYSEEYASLWLLQFPTYMAAMMIARGNPWFGGITCLIIVLLTFAWAWDVSADPTTVARVITNPVVGVIVGYVWLRGIRYFVRRERRARDATAQAEARSDAESAAAEAAARELDEVAAVTRSPLEDLAAGRELDAEFRLELAMAEARVRDRLLVPQLRHPGVEEAIGRARTRRVDVVLLGEPDPSRRISDEDAAALSSLLDTVGSGRVVVRSTPPGRPDAITVVVDRDGVVERMSLASRNPHQ